MEMRISDNQVAEAFAKTGFVPRRGKLRLADGSTCGAGAIHAVTWPHLMEEMAEPDPESCYQRLYDVYGESYLDGFWCGWDYVGGDEWSYDGEGRFAVGWRDGRAAARKVFGE